MGPSSDTASLPNILPMGGITAEALRWVQQRRATGRISQTTATSDRHTMLAFANAMGWRRLDQIGRSDVERWLAGLEHLAPGTRRNRFSVVKVFFDDQVKAGRIKRTPFAALDAPRTPKSRHRALSADQISALLGACPDARARCVVILGCQLALRRAEIAGIELGDIDWTARVIEVVGKGEKPRRLPLTAEAVEAIEAYLRESPANGGPLIRGDRKPTQPVKPVWVGRLITRLAYAAGVKRAARDGVSTHALRHTGATDMYLRSRDVMATRDMLGHSSLATTQTYVRGLDVEGLRAAMEGRRYAAGPPQAQAA